MNYSTVKAIDDYALSIGETAFLNADATGESITLTAALSTDTVLTASAAFSPIPEFSYLVVGSEYMSVTSYDLDALTLTVVRAQLGTTAAPIVESATGTVRNRNKVAWQNIATSDIVGAHNQYDINNLWGDDIDELVLAEKIQTIWLSKFINERDIANRIRQISSGSYSDTILSISGATGRSLAPEAAQLVSYVMKYYGVQKNVFGRG